MPGDDEEEIDYEEEVDDDEEIDDNEDYYAEDNDEEDYDDYDEEDKEFLRSMIKEDAEELLRNVGKYVYKKVPLRPKHVEPNNVIDKSLTGIKTLKTYRNIVVPLVQQLMWTKGYTEKPTKKELKALKYPTVDFYKSEELNKSDSFKGYIKEIAHSFPPTEKKLWREEGDFKDSLTNLEWLTDCTDTDYTEFLDEDYDDREFFRTVKETFDGGNISGKILRAVNKRFDGLVTREVYNRRKAKIEAERLARKRREEEEAIREHNQAIARAKFDKKIAREIAVEGFFGAIGHFFKVVFGAIGHFFAVVFGAIGRFFAKVFGGIAYFFTDILGDWLEKVGDWLDDAYDWISWVGLVINSILFVGMAFMAFATVTVTDATDIPRGFTFFIFGFVPLVMIFIDRQMIRRGTVLDMGTAPGEVLESKFGIFVVVILGLFYIAQGLLTGCASCAGCASCDSCGSAFGRWLLKLILPLIGAGFACIPLKVMDNCDLENGGGALPTIATVYVLTFPAVTWALGVGWAIVIMLAHTLILVFLDLFFKLDTSKLYDGLDTGPKVGEWIRTIIFLAVMVAVPVLIFMNFGNVFSGVTFF